MSKLKRWMWAARCQADRHCCLHFSFLKLLVTSVMENFFALCIWIVAFARPVHPHRRASRRYETGDVHTAYRSGGFEQPLCCGAETISSTQPECVFVALGTEHAKHMCYIDISGLPRSSIFVHLFS